MPKLSLSILALLIAASGYAQLRVWPVAFEKSNGKTTGKARTEETTLSLPFWDDFSQSQLTPDTTKWRMSESVFVGNGIGKNPPSIGVASLDAVKADGTGYLENSATGRTDALTSCFIDLSSLSVSDDVYISFFYQAGGNGDMPEATDSLALEVLDVDGNWQQIWPLGTDLNRSGDFEQAIVSLDDPIYFHNEFSFRFQAFGALQGFFDVWNVDYVYVNKNRSASDTIFPDRTISNPIGPLFGDYYALPLDQFNGQYSALQYSIKGLQDPSRPQPYRDSVYVEISTFEDGTAANLQIVYGQINGSAIAGDELRELTIPSVGSQIPDLSPYDSTFIEVNIILEASDDIIPTAENDFKGDYDIKYSPILFKSNDTTRFSYALTDYFAYDDGTAEGLVGFEQSGSRLAIRHDLPADVVDSVSAIDLHVGLLQFPPDGLPLELYIWEAEMQDTILAPGKVIASRTINIERNSAPNAFTRYEFPYYNQVQGTFFVGYRQISSTPVGVGLDLSNDTSDKVLANTGGSWSPNNAPSLDGSVMIRPVFGTLDKVTAISHTPQNSRYRIFPNPTSGVFKIDGSYSHLSIFTMAGKQIEPYISTDGDIHISEYPSGVYFIIIQHNQGAETLKLIKQ